ncbi:MAG: diguanylate cyclase domain-containing protein, partial [Myxococcota bacterium]
TLAAALEKILKNHRLEAEHARLLAENIEYMGERALFEHGAALFSSLAVDPLASRIVEGLCVETRAQGGIAWIVDDEHPDRFNLTAVRGLVRVDEEPFVLEASQIPEALADGRSPSTIQPWRSGEWAEERPALFLSLRRDGRVIGLVRLTDKLGDDEFDPVDQSCSEKFVAFGETALVNALRFAALEKRTLADPATGAFGFEYFHDVVRTEIEKSNRFGRSFFLVRVALGSLDPLRERIGEPALREWLAEVGVALQAVVRGADVLASDQEGSFLVLLPETDALGGTVFKQRAVEALAGCEGFTRLAPEERPAIQLGGVNFPGDGTQLESLLRVLDDRVERDRHSPIRELGLDDRPLERSLPTLLEQGEGERPEVPQNILRYLISEVRRRPDERGRLIVHPGPGLAGALDESLRTLGDLVARTEVVVVSDDVVPNPVGPAVVWLEPPEGAGLPSFIVQYSDGAAYALVCGEKRDGEGVRMYHTDDRRVVEHLAFQLQRELSLPELS